jgi:hypothetical protein
MATAQELARIVELPMLTKRQVSHYIRGHVGAQLYDESGCEPHGTAIYSLADPRDIRTVRYVGQTGHPQRRFLQHLSTARLWLPDETPWWVKLPHLRPLYDWIRALYRDERRLPVMVISDWIKTASSARALERSRIFECLKRDLPLLNVENETLGRQIPLI